MEETTDQRRKRLWAEAVERGDTKECRDCHQVLPMTDFYVKGLAARSLLQGCG